MGKGKSDEEQVDISRDMKRKVQPSQDNRDPMVKKLEKGATVTCYKCHGERHKFYKCPQFVKKMDKGEKKKLKPTIKSSLIYTKPNRKNKTKSNTYVIKKKANGKVVAHKVGKMMVLTPKIGTGKRLTCGPNLVKKCHSAEKFPQRIR
jgi:hypothetical protein